MTEVNAIFSTIAGLVLLLSYVPYGNDIAKGNVQPARSARLMFVLLLLVAFLQQHSLGSGWILFITLGELVGSVAIFGLAIKYGIGGLSRLDLACYMLLLLTLLIWGITDNALIALHATIATDFVAFVPTLVKTWRQPQSETALFFVVGAIAPLVGLVALHDYQYEIIAFPLYLALANAFEVVLICRHKF